MARKRIEAPKIEKHPDVIAWENYANDEKRKNAFNAKTLGTRDPDYYLRNRLESAFMAGVKYGESKGKK